VKSGISIFIAAGVALGASWCGYVLAPVLQLGGAKQAFILQSTDNWPLQRTGEATLGLQIYRANGCAACHTEQVRQTGMANQVTLTGLGIRKPQDFIEFAKSLFVLPELTGCTNAIAASLNGWDGALPKTLFITSDNDLASAMADRLKAAGVKSETLGQFGAAIHGGVRGLRPGNHGESGGALAKIEVQADTALGAGSHFGDVGNRMHRAGGGEDRVGSGEFVEDRK